MDRDGRLPMIIRPRPARPASLLVNGLKSAGYTALLWAVFLFALPIGIHHLEGRLGLEWARFDPGRRQVVAILVFAAASLVGFWSGAVLVTQGDGTPMPFATTHRLVIAGPYRHIRNPMSAMGILQGLAVGLFLGSALTLVYALAGAFVWHFVLRPWEERDLRERFGEEYERYRRSVPCWRVRRPPYTP